MYNTGSAASLGKKNKNKNIILMDNIGSSVPSGVLQYSHLYDIMPYADWSIMGSGAPPFHPDNQFECQDFNNMMI